MFFETLRADIRHTFRLAIKTPVFTHADHPRAGARHRRHHRDLRRRQRRAAALAALSRRYALVNLWSFNTKENLPRNPISPANFLDFQKMNTTLDGLEGYFTFVTPAQLQTDSGTEIDQHAVCDRRTCSTCSAAPPRLGRAFSRSAKKRR